MNPSNFKTVMPAVILLQLPLTDICIQEDNCTTLLYYPQNQTYIHTNKQTTTNTHTKFNFCNILLFVWMITGTGQKNIV